MVDKNLTSAVIAGASAALKYKREHPLESEEEALKYVVQNSKKIAREIDLD